MTTTDVLSRIGHTSAVFASLIFVRTKVLLFRSLILQILLYGSEKWTLLKTDLDRLEVFHHLRQIRPVLIRDCIRNDDIRQRCEQQPTIKEQIQERRLCWFGHVCRMDDGRLSHKFIWRNLPAEWRVQRMAPKKTWNKQVEDGTKNRRLDIDDANAIAANRIAWRRLIIEVRQPLGSTIWA